jgi:hypothetical protein
MFLPSCNADGGGAGDDAAGSAKKAVPACTTDVHCALLTSACDVGKCVGGACVSTKLADGIDCDDDDACTTGGICASGSCNGSAVNCDDGKKCTKNECDPGVGASSQRKQASATMATRAPPTAAIPLQVAASTRQQAAATATTEILARPRARACKAFARAPCQNRVRPTDPAPSASANRRLAVRQSQRLAHAMMATTAPWAISA